MLRAAGIEPEVIEYLKEPPTRERLVELIGLMGIEVRGLLRQKGTPYDDIGLGDPKWSDGELIDFMVQNPILINRPIVIVDGKARLCRPSEMVLELIPDTGLTSFTKEDGEVVSGPSATFDLRE